MQMPGKDRPRRLGTPTALLLVASTCLAASGATFAAGRAPQERGSGRLTLVSDTAGADTPAFVIGTSDVLTLSFWRQDELSGDVIVRPDGLISVPC